MKKKERVVRLIAWLVDFILKKRGIIYFLWCVEKRKTPRNGHSKTVRLLFQPKKKAQSSKRRRRRRRKDTSKQKKESKSNTSTSFLFWLGGADDEKGGVGRRARTDRLFASRTVERRRGGGGIGWGRFSTKKKKPNRKRGRVFVRRKTQPEVRCPQAKEERKRLRAAGSDRWKKPPKPIHMIRARVFFSFFFLANFRWVSQFEAAFFFTVSKLGGGEGGGRDHSAGPPWYCRATPLLLPRW